MRPVYARGESSGEAVTLASPKYRLDESAAEGGSASLVSVHRHLIAVHEAPILMVRTGWLAHNAKGEVCIREKASQLPSSL